MAVAIQARGGITSEILSSFFTTTENEVEKRQQSLDSLRGVAVLMVIVAHLAGSIGSDLSLKVFAIGVHGVDVFFALSGFLIGGILLDRKASDRLIPTFYARRALRILPAYGLLLASYFIVRALDNWTKFGLIEELYMPDRAAWSYFLLLQNNVMAYVNTMVPAWLMVTWSLAVEEQFYLVSPWIARIASTRKVVVLCLLTMVVCPLIRYGLVVKGSWLASSLLLVARADALSVGVLLAVIHRTEWINRVGRTRLGIIAAVLSVFTLGYTWQMGSTLALSARNLHGVLVWEPTIWGLGSMGVIAYLAALPNTSGIGLLNYAGKTSYFVYLFHEPAILLGTIVAAKSGANILVACCVFLALVWGLAELSWRVLEGPSQAFGRARFRY